MYLCVYLYKMRFISLAGYVEFNWDFFDAAEEISNKLSICYVSIDYI